MPLHTKALLHLKPTYELVTSKVLFSLGNAVAIVGIPLYLIRLGLSESSVGIFMGIISLAIAGLSLFLPPLLEKFNQRYLLISSAFLAGAGFAAFGFAHTAWLSMTCLIIGQVALHVNASSLTVLFKDSSRNEDEFTRDIGFLGSFTNLGWFLGPLLGGLTLSTFGFKGMFLLAGSLIALGGVYVLLFPFKTTVKKRDTLDRKIKHNLIFYLSNPQLRIAYLQNLGISLWWGFNWTFIPLFMLKGGYSDAAIGLFIALTQLPLFLLEYKTVRAVKYGFRKIFAAAYFSLAVICLVSFFTFDHSLTAVLGFIFLGSLALSFLEPISDIFFFSRISLLEEEKAYPTYITAAPTGSMLAKILPGIVLPLFYDKALFIVIGLLLSFIAYRALFIKEVQIRK